MFPGGGTEGAGCVHSDFRVTGMGQVGLMDRGVEEVTVPGQVLGRGLSLCPPGLLWGL